MRKAQAGVSQLLWSDFSASRLLNPSSCTARSLKTQRMDLNSAKTKISNCVTAAISHNWRSTCQTMSSFYYQSFHKEIFTVKLRQHALDSELALAPTRSSFRKESHTCLSCVSADVSLSSWADNPSTCTHHLLRKRSHFTEMSGKSLIFSFFLYFSPFLLENLVCIKSNFSCQTIQLTSSFISMAITMD